MTVCCLGASAEAIDAHAAALWARHRLGEAGLRLGLGLGSNPNPNPYPSPSPNPNPNLGEAAARWTGQLGTAATWLRLDTPAHAATRLGAQRARQRSALPSGKGLELGFRAGQDMQLVDAVEGRVRVKSARLGRGLDKPAAAR